MRQLAALLAVSLCVALAGCVSPPRERGGPPSIPAEAVQKAQQTTPLQAPVGEFSLAVTQANIGTTICVPGWTATVRPPSSYTNRVKRKMLATAGLPVTDSPRYELGHFVPLALGGHPQTEVNLWLQPWDGLWNARSKDRLERRLQVMVCAGKLTLNEARHAIKEGWQTAYRKFVAADPRAVPRGFEMEDDAEPVQ